MIGRTIAAMLVVLGLAAAGCQTWSSGGSESVSSDEKAKSRDEINSMSDSVLARLDSLRPGSRRTIQNAAGYAAFTNYGIQIVALGGGIGKGVAVNNRTHTRTFMRMAEAQAGIGLGARKLQLVWVFDTEQKLNDFINKGWTLGAQGSATAAYEKQGGGLEGAVQVAPGVWLYQMTETGIALELTVQGSKYYKDADLN